MSVWYFLIPAAMTVASGAGLVVQQALNSQLRVALGSGAWAGLASYLCGMLCMILLIVAMRDSMPSAAAVARTSWMSWTGGLFGAFFVAVALFFIHRLGAATFIALLFTGQMICSLALDHYGVLGLEQHSASPLRLLGAALLVVGVLLIRF
jgi:transporter family-2 protein